MSKTTKWHYATALVAAAAIAGVTGSANAAGFQLKEQSAEGQANSFAGSTAKAYDASTIFFNPAGMSRLEGNHFQINVTGLSSNVDYKADTLTGVTGNLTNGDTEGDTSAIIPTLYGVYELNEDWRLGLSINTPFGLSTDYDSGQAMSEYNMHSAIATITATPSVSYRVTDKFSIGAGLQIQYADAELTRQASPLANDSEVKLTADDLSYGATFGMLYEYSDKGRIGLSYRSRIHHKMEGEVEISGTGGGDETYDAHAGLVTPDTVGLGWYQELDDKWAVMADVTWTNWSTLNRLDVIRESDSSLATQTEYYWSDTMFYSLGANYQYDDQLKLQAGIAFDEGAANDEHRTAGIPDSDRYWVSFGGEYKFSDTITANAGYSYVRGKEVRVEETANNSNFAGDFESQVHILSLGLSVAF